MAFLNMASSRTLDICIDRTMARARLVNFNRNPSRGAIAESPTSHADHIRLHRNRASILPHRPWTPKTVPISAQSNREPPNSGLQALEMFGLDLTRLGVMRLQVRPQPFAIGTGMVSTVSKRLGDSPKRGPEQVEWRLLPPNFGPRLSKSIGTLH